MGSLTSGGGRAAAAAWEPHSAAADPCPCVLLPFWGCLSSQLPRPAAGEDTGRDCSGKLLFVSLLKTISEQSGSENNPSDISSRSAADGKGRADEVLYSVLNLHSECWARLFHSKFAKCNEQSGMCFTLSSSQELNHCTRMVFTPQLSLPGT